ncbi:natural killer cells antigen CD94 [Danio aesculapii]|uniref:natural killer cells antigen CD94 n=1 Tax=Danio aesculapii TaxID=1142201 RepID=UPI0024BFC068|nr:natural killer cells antigen CD94 [Danio aesculapii]
MTDSAIPEAVYENFNIEGHLYLKTHAQKHQPPQITGSVSVKSRKQRAVEVCLGLLCALLLTAVIMVCVFFIIQRKHLLTHITELNEEREEILNNITNLNEERQHIINQIDELQLGFYEQDQLDDNFKWIYYNFSFYYISSEKKSWSDSRRDCQQRKADLAIIKSPKEKEFLLKVAASDSYWIGLTKKYNRRWYWVDGSSFLTDWYLLRYSYYDCAMITSVSVWRGESCANLNKWICKRTVTKITY